MSKKKIFQKGLSVSTAVILCRILGLLRELLLAKIFGGGALMTAWGLAFMVPNLFRRLFGEGALGTAIVPVVSYSLENEGIHCLKKKLGAIFWALTLLLFLICIPISILSIVLANFAKVERLKITFELLPILMPYAIFICIVGAYSSALNCVGEFFLPALGTLFFNILMVLCLLFVCPLFDSKINMLKSLGISVLLAGLLQFFFTAFLLKKSGIFPILRFSQFWKEPVLAELWKLTAPGVIGAAALQISFVIDRSMACWLGDYAVPALNFSDRIIDLPIGIFAVAFTSVIAPSLSRKAAKNDETGHQKFFLHSLSTMLFLSIPASVFMFTFREPLIKILYMRGAFGEKELHETVWAMTFYCFGIPFFCCIKIISSAFYSKKDMKTPLKISLFCISLNIILNLLLMIKLKQGGIALATVISSAVNCTTLIVILKKRNKALEIRSIFTDIIRFSIAALIPATTVFYFYNEIKKFSIDIPLIPKDFLPTALSSLIFLLLFILLCVLFDAKKSD